MFIPALFGLTYLEVCYHTPRVFGRASTALHHHHDANELRWRDGAF